jgi:hypothetical protein
MSHGKVELLEQEVAELKRRLRSAARASGELNATLCIEVTKLTARIRTLENAAPARRKVSPYDLAGQRR